MTNIIPNFLLNHIILPHVPTIILPLLVVHPNITLVLANAPLAITTPLLNDITPYRPPSKPRNDRYRSRSHSNSKQNPNFQYKPSVNLTHPSTPILHNTPSTEPIFEISMYHPTTSSKFSSLSNEHANAITTSTWLVNLYIFKPVEVTSLPPKI